MPLSEQMTMRRLSTVMLCVSFGIDKGCTSSGLLIQQILRAIELTSPNDRKVDTPDVLQRGLTESAELITSSAYSHS